MSDDFPLRQSTIKAYLECPRKAFHLYMEGRASKTFPPMATGTAGHAGAEVALRAKIAGAPVVLADVEVAARAKAYELDAEVTWTGAEKMRAAFADRSAALALAYVEHVLPDVTPVDVERYVVCELGQTHVTGTVDVIEPTRIRDTKTTSKAPPAYGDPSHRFQLGLYAAMVEEACFDSRPTTAVIDYLVISERAGRKSKTDPFPLAERTVRHLPIVLNESDLAAEKSCAVATLHHVEERAARGDWSRNPTACDSWNRLCEFATECFPERARMAAAAKRDKNESEAA